MVTNNHELLGQALGTCTLRRLIGRGGMGAVYLAQQSRPRRTVAVKVLMPSTFLDQQPRDEFLMRFRREADAVAALDHINIMPIYEYGEQGDLAYLVMPYVTGGTLRQLLEKRGALPLEETVPILEQAAAALDSAHGQGIIHRDLKPGNILFHADGRVLLADFGLAKMVKEAQEFESQGNGQTALTSAGTIIGTPEYLSPEQGTGKLVDARTDVYSLGIVLFQMLGGRVPFAGASPVAIAIKHALEEPPSLVELNPAIPANVEAIVRKAIAKNPDDRYNSAGELARALREAAEHDSQKPIYASYETVVEQPGAIRLKDDGNGDDFTPAEAHNAPTAENAPVPRFNAVSTEESEPVPANKTNEPALPNALENAETLLETQHDAKNAPDDQQSKRKTPTQDKLAKKGQPKLQPVRLAQQQTVEPEQAANVYQKEARNRRKGGQPILMMLLGSLLTFILIVGGLVAYINFAHSPAQHPQSTTHTSTPVAKNTPQTQKAPGAVVLPPAQIPAGQLLYGTANPGPGCDTQGGKWVSTPGAKIICNASGTRLNNSASGQNAGMFLEAMKGGKRPSNNYIMQAQVTVKPDSHGNFEIFFLAQQGQTPATYSWMINPAANTWQANYYAKAPNISNIVVYPSSLSARPGSTITIDIAMQGNGTVLYIDGQREGGTTALGLSNGTFGLAADAGADVAFKNVEVYAAA